MPSVTIAIGAGVTPCPRCGYRNDRLGPANLSRGVDAAARLGDLSLCLQCGLVEEQTVLGRRTLTNADVDALPDELRAQLRAIERARARVLGSYNLPPSRDRR